MSPETLYFLTPSTIIQAPVGMEFKQCFYCYQNRVGQVIQAREALFKTVATGKRERD